MKKLFASLLAAMMALAPMTALATQQKTYVGVTPDLEAFRKSTVAADSNFNELYGRVPAPLRVAANRGTFPSQSVATAANQICVESRKLITLGGARQSALRVSFVGYFVNGGAPFTETPIANAQLIQESFEYNGTTVPWTWAGTAQGTIAAGANDYQSDDLYPSQFGLVSYPAGAQGYLRERRCIVTAGQLLTRGLSPANSIQMPGEGSYYSDGTSATQLLGTGAMTTPTGGFAVVNVFGPVTVLGRAIGTPDNAVGRFGDSLATGYNDNGAPTGVDGSVGGGPMVRALWNLNGRAVPDLSFGIPGDTSRDFSTGTLLRRAYFPYVTDIFYQLGTNDPANNGSTAAQVLNWDAINYGVIKSGTSSVRRTFVFGILPKVGSTYNQQPGTQTPAAGFAIGGAFRDVVNAARSVLPATPGSMVDVYYDPSPAFADPTFTDNIGYVGGIPNSNDGTHCNPASPTTPVAGGCVALGNRLAGFLASYFPAPK